MLDRVLLKYSFASENLSNTLFEVAQTPDTSGYDISTTVHTEKWWLLGSGSSIIRDQLFQGWASQYLWHSTRIAESWLQRGMVWEPVLWDTWGLQINFSCQLEFVLAKQWHLWIWVGYPVLNSVGQSRTGESRTSSWIWAEFEEIVSVIESGRPPCLDKGGDNR